MKLAPAHYERLLEQQGGCCGICKEPPRAKRRLAVDHCHRDNFVRGLLCSRCNLALAFLEDDFLRGEALKYLERAQEFSRRERRLHAVDGVDFLKMELPKEDWRLCPEPYRKEMLLRFEIQEMFFRAKMKKNQIAKNLGISRSRVERLLRGEFQWDRPVYFKSSEVLWPEPDSYG